MNISGEIATISLAQRFASASMRGEDRFAEGDWDSSATGSPRLRDALAVVDCRLERTIEHSTHAIVIGACVAAAKGRGGVGARALAQPLRDVGMTFSVEARERSRAQRHGCGRSKRLRARLAIPARTLPHADR